MAVQQSRIADRAKAADAWPYQVKGSKLASLFKGKGDPRVLDNTRGLSICNHLTKTFTAVLKEELDPYYNDFIPKQQHGAVAGRGTDLAHHFLLSALAYAAALNLCCFILYVDLVKAFDGVLRELCFGFPQYVGSSAEEQAQHLLSLGPTAEETSWVLEYLQTHGPAFKQMNVPDKLGALISALHSKSWFRADGASTFGVTAAGGRQGCKLGASIFNCCYALALAQLVAALGEEGIVARISYKSSPFWSSSEGPTLEENMLDMAFVDDLGVVLFAILPKVLSRVSLASCCAWTMCFPISP